MILDPVLPLGLVVLATAFMASFAVWRATRTRSAGRIGWFLRAAMALLLLVIALRPSIPGSSVPPTATGGVEVYFVVDTTSSMAAEDVPSNAILPGAASPVSAPRETPQARPATRLDVAKADIVRIADALAGAQFSLTTFDAAAVQRVPLTSDATALESAVGAMTQEVTFYSHGSSIDAPLLFMTELLATAKAEHPDRRRVMFYLGDGEQTRAAQPQPFDALAPYIAGGAVLGYGTAEGGAMRVFDGFDLSEERNVPGGRDEESAAPAYIEDPTTGQRALSRIDQASLETLASQLRVPYSLRTAGGSVDDLVDAIDVGATGVRPGSIDGPVEFYWIFAIPLGLLALREVLSAGYAVVRARPVERRTT